MKSNEAEECFSIVWTHRGGLTSTDKIHDGAQAPLHSQVELVLAEQFTAGRSSPAIGRVFSTSVGMADWCLLWSLVVEGSHSPVTWLGTMSHFHGKRDYTSCSCQWHSQSELWRFRIICRVNYDVLESFQSCITETYSEATTLKAAGQR